MEKKIYINMAAVCFLYFIFIAVTNGVRTSFLIVWPLFSGLFLLLAYRQDNVYLSRLPRGLFTIAKAGLAVCGCLFLVFMGFCIWGTKTETNAKNDYIIILGAGVNDTRPSLALEKRLETAKEYMTEHESTIAVATGGLGENDSITEAGCMWNWLTENGIDASRIIMEDKATTTEENFIFAFLEIEARENADKLEIGVVTSNFHVFRSVAIARKMAKDKGYSYSFNGISADFPVYLLPHYMVREFLVTAWYTVKGDLALKN